MKTNTIEVGQLGCEVDAFICSRPEVNHHSRTLGAAAQRIHLSRRARHSQGWVEGGALS